jgi:ribose/xylose/arabinose/galactoside ABC-type transport system permease subunit
LTIPNILNILRQTTVIGIITVGMAFVLISGGIDLSVGSVLSVAGIVCAYLAAPGGPAMARTGFTRVEGVTEALAAAATFPLIVPVLASVLVGAAFGAVNGVLVAKGGIAPFIVTMGMMTISRGIALIISGGGQLPYLTDIFKTIGRGSIFGIPYLGIILIVVVVIAAYVLRQTCFGRHVYAVGGNETAAHTSGIRVDWVKIAVYIISGMCAGFAGMLLTSRTAVGSPQVGAGYELDAIASCVIGGVSLTGGVGNIYGSFLGVLFIAVMGNGMDMIGLTTYYQSIAKGIIIILAVLYDMKSSKASNK